MFPSNYIQNSVSLSIKDMLNLWWRTIRSYCVSRLDRHVTNNTSHMLYICIYLP